MAETLLGPLGLEAVVGLKFTQLFRHTYFIVLDLNRASTHPCFVEMVLISDLELWISPHFALSVEYLQTLPLFLVHLVILGLHPDFAQFLLVQATRDGRGAAEVIRGCPLSSLVCVGGHIQGHIRGCLWDALLPQVVIYIAWCRYLEQDW